ncbi:SSUH2-like protein [Cryptotermes secundus]|uniref:SSUH2-like protein n=1 Tax=Cryptotermes secundus TaxID=105785 RepID=A0A2J7R4C8_9NEOP|nr:protein SSUH2 homolog [Cryptotermes secundus]PNF35665.1 SSUH2-like protein [Cryptotermes secundus]PNF35666.1 SSUH2-like protein [Cryptotermes secundus]
MTGKKNGDNPSKPSAPYSTGTIPKHGNRPRGVDFEGLYDYDSTMPSAPPLDQMEQVSGYETISFNSVSVPPPPSPSVREMWWEDSLNHSVQPPHPNVSEKIARQALLQHVKKHWCYGESAARNMAITKLKHSSAFHYELQTFTEKRETSWKFVPYSGGEVDGAENGPAPLPWDINSQPSDMFKNEEKFIRVPHTSSVKQCHRCKGAGHIVCAECYGKGWIRCQMCNGYGYRTQSEQRERCINCSLSRHGRGRQDCNECNAKGKLSCSVCEGHGQILCYIRLTVTWKVNTSEHIVEDMALPEKLVRFVSGQVAYEEEGPQVIPLQGFPDEAINMASAQLVQDHLRKYQDQRILAQRQQVRVVPITSVRYEWKGYDGEFWLCGYENKVHAPDYPQTCCCYCSCTLS